MQLDETIMTISNYISVQSSSASWTITHWQLHAAYDQPLVLNFPPLSPYEYSFMHVADVNLASYPGHVGSGYEADDKYTQKDFDKALCEVIE